MGLESPPTWILGGGPPLLYLSLRGSSLPTAASMAIIPHSENFQVVRGAAAAGTYILARWWTLRSTFSVVRRSGASCAESVEDGVRYGGRWLHCAPDPTRQRAGHKRKKRRCDTGAWKRDWQEDPRCRRPCWERAARSSFLSGPNRVELAHEAFLSFLFYFLFSLSQFKLQLEFKFDFCDKLVSNLNIPLEYDMR
jgi:hypothetical protein